MVDKEEELLDEDKLHLMGRLGIQEVQLVISKCIDLRRPEGFG
jgi:hypothetical protein